MKTMFLDRDGVINRNLDNDYVKSWDEFEFLPNALKANQHLTNAGYRVIVITNQACVNKGIISSQTLDGIHQRMVAEIERAGGCIHAIYYCPHREEERCDCRKPRPGMLIQAAHEHAVDLPHACLIGDSIRDIAAGQQVGCRTFLVLTGHTSQRYQKQAQNATFCNNPKPEKFFADLYSAALWFLEEPN